MVIASDGAFVVGTRVAALDGGTVDGDPVGR